MVTRVLELHGIGYSIAREGDTLLFQLGHSHEDRMAIPSGVTVTVDKTRVECQGDSVMVVHTFADRIRRLKAPDPYKGKGFRYAGEVLTLKKGKKK